MREISRHPRGWENLTKGQRNKVLRVWANNWRHVTVAIEKKASPLVDANGVNHDFIRVEFRIKERVGRWVARIASKPAYNKTSLIKSKKRKRMTPVDLIKQRIDVLKQDKTNLEQEKENATLQSSKWEYGRKIKHTENVILLNESLLKSMSGGVKNEN